jgi:hypothetical protein
VDVKFLILFRLIVGQEDEEDEVWLLEKLPIQTYRHFWEVD